ncbi:MAG UNVERIFIED_CONTAM: hypothetical protein LVR18_35480 [Planctomycetaceae bacterium]
MKWPDSTAEHLLTKSIECCRHCVASARKSQARLARIDLPLAGVPNEAELQQQAEQSGVAGSRASWFLEQLKQGNPVPTTVPGYPVQTWCFGDDLAMVFLGGEVVVDYALRMNDMFDGSRLWINAYSNDVPCYIASAQAASRGRLRSGFFDALLSSPVATGAGNGRSDLRHRSKTAAPRILFCQPAAGLPGAAEFLGRRRQPENSPRPAPGTRRR